ncbi:hypothetical protein [Streptomyces chilikensis]|uniref:hypothetical protein n=1 Tax=Streptomyces chilikensis TaxID=1194079 RepID=UPI000AEBD078|nr:hypothetical protein [Streptomyces chilikensis]
MGAWAQECEGRGDGTRCPTEETLTVDAGLVVYRCDECRHHWELDETEPGRRAGNPGEAGHGAVA